MAVLTYFAIPDTPEQFGTDLDWLYLGLSDEIATTTDQESVTPPAFTSEQLRTGLESLPQELYNEISTLTFSYDGGSREIDEAYKPPVQLQVNRETRQEFSQSYYGSPKPWWHSREMHGHWRSSADHDDLYLPVFSRWLKSRSQEAKLILYQTHRVGECDECGLEKDRPDPDWEPNCYCPRMFKWAHTGAVTLAYYDTSFNVKELRVMFWAQARGGGAVYQCDCLCEECID